MSPFSPLQKYTLKTFPYEKRERGSLTEWEEQVLDFLDEIGAATYFQLAYKDKQKKKLNRLNNAGLMRKYRLEGESPILVAASRPYELQELLKALAFTQLIIRLREKHEVEIVSEDIIKINKNLFTVLILRETDNIIIPPVERLIIVSETFRPEFKEIAMPARIVLDKDLLSEEVIFYLPSGEQE